jgi:hypothetical protein
MVDIATSLTRAFDSAIDRLTIRLGGMSDEEYLWEPVTDCWSLRPGADGRWTIDGGPLGNLDNPPPQRAPVTTIAWRIGHLGFGLGGFASTRFGDGRLLTQPAEFPDHATNVGPFLNRHYQMWRAGIVRLDDRGWDSPLPASWGGRWAEMSTFDLALHVLDEVVHHGAEVGVLRDLYRQRSSLSG